MASDFPLFITERASFWWHSGVEILRLLLLRSVKDSSCGTKVLLCYYITHLLTSAKDIQHCSLALLSCLWFCLWNHLQNWPRSQEWNRDQWSQDKKGWYCKYSNRFYSWRPKKMAKSEEVQARKVNALFYFKLSK